MKKKLNRERIGKTNIWSIELPDLIEIQTKSYENFLQIKALEEGKPLEKKGLQEVFTSVFPIENAAGNIRLEYESYYLDKNQIKYTEEECRKKSLTYSVPLKAKFVLKFLDTGVITEKEIFVSDIPLMTDSGTFIVNGAERVIVSQIHRTPGVIFAYDKNVYIGKIIPYKGSWLEFEVDNKKQQSSLIYVKVDKKKKVLVTIFLRALGFETSEQIVKQFYKTKVIKVSEIEEYYNKTYAVHHSSAGKHHSLVLAKDIFDEEGLLKIRRIGENINLNDTAEFERSGIEEIEIIDYISEDAFTSSVILDCLSEEVKYSVTNNQQELSRDEAISIVNQNAANDQENPITAFMDVFFNPRRYDLGKVGRYKISKRFGVEFDESEQGPFVLKEEDIIKTIRTLIRIYSREESPDDIDHLSNRRVRSVGELLANQIKVAFTKMEKSIKDKMNSKADEQTLKPHDIISIKPIITSIKDFFASSQLSQFMDQINPLSELTHKRRLSALGSGGIARDRASFEVRDVHYTHYGRLCPIETPEGQNIGLIVSLASYTMVNDYGFIETPYRKVVNGRATKEIEYLSAIDEDKYYIAQSTSPLDEDGNFLEEQVSVRKSNNYPTRAPQDIQYMDVSPKQVISISTSLIPFLEHDDANRALMGSNMQRQAVPLMTAEPPRIGTGMEYKAAYDSGVLVKAKKDGVVKVSTNSRIEIENTDGTVDSFNLTKFRITNQDTFLNQRPIVKTGQQVKAKDVLADNSCTVNGELALGKNILMGFLPWNGYNFEDAILISERLVKEDVFTSIHIKEFKIDVIDTKLGPETVTREVPNVAENLLSHLDEEGIVNIGTYVKTNDILVGKTVPRASEENMPELKLLNQIFGEKSKDTKDGSLRVPHGIEGTVVDIQVLSKANKDELPPGTEKTIKVFIASKHKIKEGDKMAGRHGNKGVVALVLPVEDMPFLEDGTPLDMCLNPLGVPSRMNLGQILEAQLGLAAYGLDKYFAVPVFESASVDQIEEMLIKAGLPKSAKLPLYDGRTGEKFENDIFVGCMYMIKLHHLVDYKMHARSIGTYSLVTQQPLGGKAQFGGQRLGEMEVWALEAYGASNVLQEFLTVKSDDINGRTKIYGNIVKGAASSDIGIPESFNVLVQELKSLCLDLTVYDGKNNKIALTEKDRKDLESKSEAKKKDF